MSVDALALLQEDLKDDDFTLAMRSVNRLATIGLALGPTRTREELIPYLQEYVEDDNDEAHCAIAKQLGDFVPLVGGANTPHVACLLPILEKFAGEEETVIRDAGVASLTKVIPALLAEDRATHLFPLLKRLAEGDWFTSRSSACQLTVAAYTSLSGNADLQQQMRTWYTGLCHDETPMVKKAAFKALGDFAVAMDAKFFLAEFPEVLREISVNDMDGLRLFTVDACVSTATILTGAEYKQCIIPLIEGCEDDTSWRVRTRLGDKMPDIIRSVPDKDLVDTAILPVYAKLLIDREPEVRIKAVSRLVTIAEELKGSSAFVEHIAPSLDALTNDSEANVRRAFSTTLVPLCNAFPRDAAAKLLLPLMLALCHDDTYLVRHNVVADLHNLQDNQPNGILHQMVPKMLELAKDPKWRVRMAIIEKSSLLAEALGQRVFERKLQNLIIVSLSDHVSAIREKACVQCAKVVGIFGGAWAQKQFFPSAFTIYDTSTNYLHRMTCLLLIQNVACEAEVDNEVYETTLFPLLAQAFVDEVANVRLMACQTLSKMLPHLSSSTISDRVSPALALLAADTDSDVTYFASVCTQQIDASA